MLPHRLWLVVCSALCLLKFPASPGLSWFRPRAATLQCKFDLAQGESAGFLPAHSPQRVLIVQLKKALDLSVQSKLTAFFYVLIALAVGFGLGRYRS